MPERWQRELKKIRKVEMPESVRERIDLGPTGERMPPRRQRVVAGVVALSVFAAAGAFAWNAFRGGSAPIVARSGTRVVTIDLTEGPAGGSGLLSFAGHTQSGVPGSPLVTPDGIVSCRHPIPRVPGSTAVPADARIRLSGNGRAEEPPGGLGLEPRPEGHAAGIGLLLDTGQGLNFGAGAIPPGRYLLEIPGRWPGGEPFVFFFGIELVPGPTPSPTRPAVVKIWAPSAIIPPRATLVFNGLSVDGSYTPYSWTGGSTSHKGETESPHFSDARFHLRMPAGTEIVIRGRAERVDGSIDATGGFPFGRLEPLDLSTGRATLAADPGTYVLELTAHWLHGDVSFFFPIEIQGSSSS